MTALVNMQTMPRDLSRRSTQAEWLDGGNLDPAELALVLRDLARFNAAMLGHRPVIGWLKRAVKNAPRDRSLTLVDVGCGYGDLLRAIRRWARKCGLSIRLIGLDLSRETIAIARTATSDADEIDYQVADVFAYRPAEPVDFVVSSLLTHHLSDAMIEKFLQWMEATAQRGWLVYDLQRHFVPHFFIGLMGRLTRLHRIVIHDGRVSVARSLTRAEWDERIVWAGVPREAVTLRWFLFRYVIGRLQ